MAVAGHGPSGGVPQRRREPAVHADGRGIRPPIEGESFAASLTDPGARQADSVLRDAGAALDLPQGLAGLQRAPATERLRRVRPGCVGALRPRARPCAVEEPGRAGAGPPGDAQESGSTTRASTTDYPWTTGPSSMRISPNARTGRLHGSATSTPIVPRSPSSRVS